MKIVNSLFIGLMLLSSPISLFAQTWDEVKAESSRYVWGEGWGGNLEQADRAAMSALSSKISITFINEFQSTEGQTSSGREKSRYSSIENNIRSFSSAALCNCGMEILESGKQYHVVRWISRDAVEQTRIERTKHTFDYLREAETFEFNGKPSDALRNYYWAYAMLKSYPEIASATYRDQGGHIRCLSSWLPQKINDVLSGTRASVISGNGRQATIIFSFNGNPTRNIEFSYYDGAGWSRNTIARDGRITVPLCFNKKPEYLHIELTPTGERQLS